MESMPVFGFRLSFPRIRLGLLVAAGLLAAESRAKAVLFPDMDAKFEAASIYAGCPAIGAGAAQPEPELCAKLRKPENYCSAFHVVASMKNDPDSQRAEKACVAFYKAALDA